jgi:predicted transcriptional regulator
MDRPKPSELSKYIRQARIDRGYPTTEAFWEYGKKNFGDEWISLSYYVRVENGTKTPTIETALRIAGLLKLDERKVCNLFAAVMMPDEKRKAYFLTPDLVGEEVKTEAYEEATKQIRLQRPFVMSGDILTFFSENLNCLDVFIALLSMRATTRKDLAKAVRLGGTKVNHALNVLIRHGLVLKHKDAYLPVKERIEIESDPETLSAELRIIARNLRACFNNGSQQGGQSLSLKRTIPIRLPRVTARELIEGIRYLCAKAESDASRANDDTDCVPFFIGCYLGQRFVDDGGDTLDE